MADVDRNSNSSEQGTVGAYVRKKASLLCLQFRYVPCGHNGGVSEDGGGDGDGDGGIAQKTNDDDDPYGDDETRTTIVAEREVEEGEGGRAWNTDVAWRIGREIKRQIQQDLSENDEIPTTTIMAKAKDIADFRRKYGWKANGSRAHKAGWDENFQSLIAYREEHGHCRIQNHPELGKWAAEQRAALRDPERLKTDDMMWRRWRLEKVGFVFDDWLWALGVLKRYKENHGDCQVPFDYRDEEEGDYHLGGWVKTQRDQYRKREEDKYSTMTEERREQLNALGFDWRLRKRRRRSEDG